MHRVAVHLVTYNNEDTIHECLSALLAQDEPFTLHIIDNASTDQTVERMKALGLAVHVNKTNVGYAVAHNQALAATQSDYVLTLNPDLVLQPGFLAEMRRALDTEPRLGSAAGRLLRVEQVGAQPHAIDSVGLYLRRNRRQGLLMDGAPVSDAPTDPRPIFGPDGAAAFYRRAMLDDISIGGEIFDEDFFIHKEDVDICWRAQLAGWRSTYVPGAIAHHIRTFRPGQRGTVSSFLRMCAVRNRYLLMMKNEIPVLFWRDLWRIAAYDLAIIGYLVLRERASLRGLTSAWALRGKMWEKRRAIHAKRRASADEIAALLT
jgi:GT2 family glycosyltransferase